MEQDLARERVWTNKSHLESLFIQLDPVSVIPILRAFLALEWCCEDHRAESTDISVPSVTMLALQPAGRAKHRHVHHDMHENEYSNKLQRLDFADIAQTYLTKIRTKPYPAAETFEEKIRRKNNTRFIQFLAFLTPALQPRFPHFQKKSRHFLRLY